MIIRKLGNIYRENGCSYSDKNIISPWVCDGIHDLDIILLHQSSTIQSIKYKCVKSYTYTRRII